MQMKSMGRQAIYDIRIETSVPPERLLAAATDFSSRRPDLWPTITRKRYRVFSVGDHTAEVEEGTTPVHHRYKYAWTDDGVVRATTVDATVMNTGSIWELRVRPRDGGGSNVHIHVEMGFKGLAKPIGPLVMRLNGGGAETYRKWFMKTLAVLEADVRPPRSVARDLTSERDNS
jgi:hypothetical protein